MSSQLINFDSREARSADELLSQIGIMSDLGTFLIHHLTEVLRKQNSDTIILSIEFVGTGRCSAGGFQAAENVVELDVLCIPVDTNLVVSSNNQMLGLKLQIKIISDWSGIDFNIRSDILIKSQSII